MNEVTRWLAFAAERLPDLERRLGEHSLLVAGATSAAVAIGVPLAVLAADRPRLRGCVLGVAGILQTIPSLALLVALLAIMGELGARPALVALTVYALLPILQGGVTGLDTVSPELLEAGRGVGMTPWQVLLRVRLPIAAPVIAAGIRTAAVTCVGVATLAAFVGAGGLGQFILRGLSLADTRLVLLGALPAAALALLVDGALAAAAWGARPRSRKGARARPALAAVALAAPFALLGAGGALAAVGPGPGGAPDTRPLRVGSKDFAEQLLLGELAAQALEAEGIPVERHLNLGGTAMVQQALSTGAIDVYVEYTGTALTAVLGLPPDGSPEQVRDLVRREYSARFDCEWLGALGFDNTYALAARRDVAARRGWRTISDLVGASPPPRLAVTAEFAERPDGLPGLRRAYDGLTFADVRDLDPALLHRAARDGATDVVVVFSTDGRVASHGLVVLEDDRGFFPPYEATPVARRAALTQWPAARATLVSLAGTIDDDAMRAMNAALDAGRRPRDVAAEHLRRLSGGR